LGRIREALPIIARRTELTHELRKYASAVLLPEDFGEKRRKLLTTLQIAENDRTKAREAIETIAKAAGELHISERILENAELIEELYREVGSQNKAAKDKVRLETRRSVLRGEATDILRGLREDLTLEAAAKLRIKKTETVRISELGTRYERIVTRIESNREEIPKVKRHVDNLKKELKTLEAPKSVDALKDTLAQAEEFGALEKHCRAEQREVQRALQNLEAALGRQTLWRGTLTALESLSVPLTETIDAFEDQMDAAERRLADLEAEITRIDGERQDIDRQLEALQIEHAVPTEQDLLAARHLRD
jgi:chromosome segregation ATPase